MPWPMVCNCSQYDQWASSTLFIGKQEEQQRVTGKEMPLPSVSLLRWWQQQKDRGYCVTATSLTHGVSIIKGGGESKGLL